MTVSRLTEFVSGWIWTAAYPVRYSATRFPGTMTVLRLADDRLMIHSPGPLDTALQNEISSLGRIAFIVAPGTFHHLHLAACRSAFPDAETWICPGIERKRPRLEFDWILSDQPDPRWRADLDQALVRGGALIAEVAFFHRAARTLVLVDVVENMGDRTPGTNWALRFWWKFLFRMWNRARPAPEYRFAWRDRSAAGRSLRRILQWDFDQVLMAHGEPITENAHAVIEEAWRPLLRRA